MCGRYASARSVDDIAAAFGLDDPGETAPADWNVAPTKAVTAVIEADGRRTCTVLRWGLVPAWAPDPSVGARMINARAETAADRPAFRAALAARRCLLPADGWYEWQARPDGARVPHYLAPADAGPLAFAGLWETWWDAAGRPLRTATILTGPAPGDLAHVHDRAPIVLAPAVWADWLDPARRDTAPLLRPTPPGVVVPRPVGPAIGDVRARGRELTAPVVVPEQDALF